MSRSVELTSKGFGAGPLGAGLLSFVLITPARNEAAFIELTIQSVVAQTVKPRRWVIVSDGSTDGTDDIVRRYAAQHEWIELVRTPERAERHFAGKVHAFNAGYERVKQLNFDVIASLDADITFEPDYFEFLLTQFAKFPELGVAGTPFREGTAQYDYRFVSQEHVSGACQVFRRRCFEDIGGYTPVKRGIDLVAVTTARMKGWKTRCFIEKASQHHRAQGTGDHQSPVARVYWSGYYDYLLGVCLRWQVVRSIYQMRCRPWVLGGFVLLVGYLWAWITQRKRIVSPDLAAFRRKEQIARLKAFVQSFLRRSDSLPSPGVTG